MENQLIKAAVQAVKSLYGADVSEQQVQVQQTRKDFEGDLTLVVFPFLRLSRKSPETTAEEIGNYFVQEIDAVASFNVVKGFLNIVINKGQWLATLNTIHKNEQFGFKKADENSELVMVEYSSPNTNKPLHLGHIRNNLLGFSISEILKANGYNVVKTNIVNDRGIHICKSMLA